MTWLLNLCRRWLEDRAARDLTRVEQLRRL
jgi:hypothetical protein